MAFFLLVSTEDFSSAKPPPLLESDGTSIKVLGFSLKQRAVFIHVLMRYIVRLQTGHKNSLLFLMVNYEAFTHSVLFYSS
jgi:hypothetical protein